MASGRTPSLQRYTEFDVLQRFHATLNKSITDPDIFAVHLIAEGFMSQQVAANKMPLGLSNFQKVGHLLGVVDSHIKSARVVSYERVREKFMAFLSVLNNSDLNLGDIARKMEEQCYGTLSIQPQPQAASTRGSLQPQSETTSAPQLQAYAQSAPHIAVSIQPQQMQSQAADLNFFSKDMNNEQLALWLSHHPKLIGTDFSEDINKLRESKINGHTFLNLSETKLERLKVSIGFSMLIPDVIEELKMQPLGSQNGSQTSRPATDAFYTSATSISTPEVKLSISGQDQLQPGPCRRLRDEDHHVIYSKLAEYADKWLYLGAELGFKNTELTIIQANPTLLLQSPPKSYLRQMLSQWLQWGPGDARGSPDFANSLMLRKALLKTNLASIAYELDSLLTKC